MEGVILSPFVSASAPQRAIFEITLPTSILEHVIREFEWNRLRDLRIASNLFNRTLKKTARKINLNTSQKIHLTTRFPWLQNSEFNSIQSMFSIHFIIQSTFDQEKIWTLMTRQEKLLRFLCPIKRINSKKKKKETKVSPKQTFHSFLPNNSFYVRRNNTSQWCTLWRPFVKMYSLRA